MCSIDTFQPRSKATSCDPCPSGTGTLEEGSAECIGRYFNVVFKLFSLQVHLVKETFMLFSLQVHLVKHNFIRILRYISTRSCEL